jgi:predicted O-methyltransferase YrrM
MPFSTDFTLASSVKGFLDDTEGEFLYETALKASFNGPCMEIGSYCGKSTVYIGMACRQNGAILFALDHHKGSEEQQPGEEHFDPALFDYHIGNVNTFSAFRRTLAKAQLENTVVPIVCASSVAAKQWATPLSMLFIDGGHAFETVHADYQLWSPHVMPGGYILFHDIFEDSRQGGQAPFRVYSEAVTSGIFQDLGKVGSIGVLKRNDTKPLTEAGIIDGC